MKKLLYILFMLFVISCSTDNEILVPEHNDITFSELSVDRFSHVVKDGGFTSGEITFNTKGSDRNYRGFAYSSRSHRSFVWSGSDIARDSNRFSVYTPNPNLTGIYAVANAVDEECYFTLGSPRVIEHLLIAPTTEGYLGMNYGAKSDEIVNPGVPSAPKREWETFIPNLTNAMAVDGDYYKVIITGYNGTKQTGSVEHFICCRKGADIANPDFSFLRNDWLPVKLTSLGEVTKVLFSVECSRKIGGQSIIPPYFCVDGIRIKR